MKGHSAGLTRGACNDLDSMDAMRHVATVVGWYNKSRILQKLDKAIKITDVHVHENHIETRLEVCMQVALLDSSIALWPMLPNAEHTV